MRVKSLAAWAPVAAAASRAAVVGLSRFMRGVSPVGVVPVDPMRRPKAKGGL